MAGKGPKSRSDVKSPTRHYSSRPRTPDSGWDFARKPSDYRSEGVKDNDVFELPTSDYKLMLIITAIAIVVRLFRIYQPSSVVFDEVQLVNPMHSLCAYHLLSRGYDADLMCYSSTVSVVLRRNILKENSSWMYTPRLRSC